MRRHGPVTKSFTATAASSASTRSALPPSAAAGARPSNAPTAQYRAHYSVVEPRVDKTEFRPFWRVHSHLAALVEAGRITGQEFETALLWRRWNEELGRQRVQRWDSIRIGQSLVPRVAAVRQLDAATQLRAAAEALGPQRTALLDWSIRDDLTWVRIGRRINLSDKTVIVRVVETLQALALWHAGRPVPPPPRTRPYNRPRSW